MTLDVPEGHTLSVLVLKGAIEIVRPDKGKEEVIPHSGVRRQIEVFADALESGPNALHICSSRVHI